MNHLRTVLAVAACVACLAPAWAGTTFTMTFDGIAPAGVPSEKVGEETVGSAVLGFYNGDPVYGRKDKKPWNTTFSSNALSICPESVDEEKCFGQAPPLSSSSGSYVATVVMGSIEFELTGPFLSNLSFYYFTAASDTAPVLGLQGDGFIDEIPLSLCEGGCWLKFDGLKNPLDATQRVNLVRFSGTQNSLAIDDIEVTTTGGTAIPEPSTYVLMATGLVLLAGARRRRAPH